MSPIADPPGLMQLPTGRAGTFMAAKSAYAVLSFVGRIRFSFNRHGAAPLVWSIAIGSFEIAVREVSFHGVLVETVYRPKATPDDEDGRPSAWLECSGTVRVFEDGRAEVGP